MMPTVAQKIASALSLASAATRAKALHGRRVAMRNIARKVTAAQFEAGEDAVERALVPFFEQQIQAVAAGLLDMVEKGGPGSGDWGHSGRPGQVGGSGGGGGAHNLPSEHPHYRPSGGAAVAEKPKPEPTQITISPETLEAAKTLLGPEITPEKISKIAGLVGNGAVFISSVAGGLQILIKGSGYSAERYISKKTFPEPEGLVLHNDEFKVDPNARGKGLGTRIFVQQVEEAAKVGIKKIECFAAGNANEPQWNGYITWPKLGYDGDIPSSVKNSLPPQLSKAKKISDLMKTPEGRDWWKKNGRGADVVFDLAPGSLSRKVLDGYVKAKEAKNKEKGGPGSGDWGHSGRPGQVGGSGGGGGHHTLPPDHQYAKPKPKPAEPAYQATVLTSMIGEETPEKVAIVTAHVQKVLGDKNATLEDAARVCGFPSGSTLRVGIKNKTTLSLYLKTDGHPQIKTMERYLVKGIGDGPPRIENEMFVLKAGATGTGLGTKIFHAQVQEAAKLGIKEIRTVGGGSSHKDSNWNGYYTWPRLGYDGDVVSLKGNKPPGGQTRLSDLMKSPEGRKWWKENGDEVNLTFDPTPGSLSRKVLDAYVAAKEAKNKAWTKHLPGQHSQQSHGGGGPGFEVRLTGGYDLSTNLQENFSRVAKKLLGKDASPVEVALIGGAQPGSTVSVEVRKDSLKIEWHNQELGVESAKRWLETRNGKTVLENRVFRIGEGKRGTGTGTKVFAQQVEHAAKAGVDRIETYAAGHGSEFGGGNQNGYYTWPRLGYDGKIPEKSRKFLPAELQGAAKVSDLMKTHEGRRWWKHVGTDVDATFDLKAGSQSRQVLDNYIKDKKNGKAKTGKTAGGTGKPAGNDSRGRCDPGQDLGQYREIGEKATRAENPLTDLVFRPADWDLAFMQIIVIPLAKSMLAAFTAQGELLSRANEKAAAVWDHKFWKHLPGQHSQQSHAGGGGARGLHSGPRNYKVTLQDSPEWIKATAKMLGLPEDMADVAALIGAPHGSKIDVFLMEADSYSYDERSILIDYEHKELGVTATRMLQLDANGDFICGNAALRVEPKNQGKGIGTKLLLEQVKQLSSKTDAKEIRLEAAGKGPEWGKGTKQNGYYTWPRLGFDSKIPNDLVEFVEAKRGDMVSSLMKSADGRILWSHYGKSTEMSFDLKAGSQSRQVLEAYAAKKFGKGRKFWKHLPGQHSQSTHGRGGGGLPSTGQGMNAIAGKERAAKVTAAMEKFKTGWPTPGSSFADPTYLTIAGAARLAKSTPLAGDTGPDFYETLGHSRETFVAVQKVLVEHGLTSGIQARADVRVMELLREDSAEGRMMRDIAIAETYIVSEFYKGHKLREDNAKREVEREAELDAKLGLPKWDDDKLRQAIDDVTGYPPPKLYRGGKVGENRVESWTRDERGANTGGAGRIKIDHKEDIGKLLDRGYISVGGMGRMTGAPGESEVTMVNFQPGKLEKAHKATTASEWAAGLNPAFDPLVWTVPTPHGEVRFQVATEFPGWVKRTILLQLEESFAQPYWTNVNLTTHADIEKYLKNGVINGQSIEDIARQIAPDLLEEGRYAIRRARLIARTELGHALNGAKTAAIEEVIADVGSEELMRRIWVSVLGNTTRATHAHNDNVPADETGRWNVGGAWARWPSDIYLPARERCNCQCSVDVEFGMQDAEARELIEDAHARTEAELAGNFEFEPDEEKRLALQELRALIHYFQAVINGKGTQIGPVVERLTDAGNIGREKSSPKNPS